LRLSKHPEATKISKDLRHANAKITLDLYTQAISSQKRDANTKDVEMMLPTGGKREKPQHHSAPSGEEKGKAIPLIN
jgi:histidyl-tRNA synthetase